MFTFPECSNVGAAAPRDRVHEHNEKESNTHIDLQNRAVNLRKQIVTMIECTPDRRSGGTSISTRVQKGRAGEALFYARLWHCRGQGQIAR
jgi:hypothetical protein